MNVTANTGYKAKCEFTGEEFPAYAIRGVLIDARTGMKAECPMGVATVPVSAAEFDAMCDAFEAEQTA